MSDKNGSEAIKKRSGERMEQRVGMVKTSKSFQAFAMKPLHLMAWAIDTGEGHYMGFSPDSLTIFKTRQRARRARPFAKIDHPRARVVRIRIRIEHG